MDYTLQPSPLFKSTKGVTDISVEGVWTPAMSFATQGDLGVVYGVNVGRYYRFLNLVYVTFAMETSNFNYTTSSGEFRVLGLPFPSGTASSLGGGIHFGNLSFEGIVMAGFTQFTPAAVAGNSYLVITGSGESQTMTGLTTTQVGAGTQKKLYGSLLYSLSN